MRDAAYTDELAALAARLTQAECRCQRAERRFRTLCGVLLGVAALAVLLPLLSKATAQVGVTATQRTALDTWTKRLEARISALEKKTASMSLVPASDRSNTSGQPAVRFTGVNVQIVNGVGSTLDDFHDNKDRSNGRGNLIIGYNAVMVSRDEIKQRTGSHCLIVGDVNTYNHSGGIVAGIDNLIGGYYATVTGGWNNKSVGEASSVSGGASNFTDSFYSSISGGSENEARDEYSSVSGGWHNHAGEEFSSISGGQNKHE